MIRHCVLIDLDDAATDADKQAMIDGLRALPGIIDEIRSYTVGIDLGLVKGNASLTVVGDFDNEADFRTYAGHPEHLRVIADYIKPFITGRSAAQIEI